MALREVGWRNEEFSVECYIGRSILKLMILFGRRDDEIVFVMLV